MSIIFIKSFPPSLRTGNLWIFLSIFGRQMHAIIVNIDCIKERIVKIARHTISIIPLNMCTLYAACQIDPLIATWVTVVTVLKDVVSRKTMLFTGASNNYVALNAITQKIFSISTWNLHIYVYTYTINVSIDFNHIHLKGRNYSLDILYTKNS